MNPDLAAPFSFDCCSLQIIHPSHIKPNSSVEALDSVCEKPQKMKENYTSLTQKNDFGKKHVEYTACQCRART